MSIDRLHSREELRRSVDGMFSVGYTTLTSIIQGAVFAFLLGILDQEKFWSGDSLTLSPHQWCIAAVAFLTIILTWQEYMIGVTIFNWVPGLIDSIIPFALGVAQFGLCLSIKHGIGWSLESM